MVLVELAFHGLAKRAGLVVGALATVTELLACAYLHICISLLVLELSEVLPECDLDISLIGG